MDFQDQNCEVSIGHEWAFPFLGSRLESQLQNFLRWTLMLLVLYYKGEAYQADESVYLLCLIMSFHLLLESQSGIFWAEQWWHSCCHNPPAAECLGTGSSQEAPHTRMRLIWHLEAVDVQSPPPLDLTWHPRYRHKPTQEIHHLSQAPLVSHQGSM